MSPEPQHTRFTDMEEALAWINNRVSLMARRSCNAILLRVHRAQIRVKEHLVNTMNNQKITTTAVAIGPESR